MSQWASVTWPNVTAIFSVFGHKKIKGYPYRSNKKLGLTISDNHKISVEY